VDFYLRRRPGTSDRERLRLSRISTLAWAAVLFTLAILSRNIKVVVEVGLAIASVAYGALLGVFVLGVLTKRANERGAMVGFFCGFVFNLYLWQEQRLWAAVSRASGVSLALPHGGVPFTWYVALGSTLTFAVGYLASLFYAASPTQELVAGSRGRNA
jgi:Na+(H+)/acetate symporter ActP